MISHMIKIDKIILTTQIVKAVLKYDPNKLFNNKIIYDGSFELNRMELIMLCDNFEPIQIKLDHIDNKNEFYKIINGRHRICKAIIDNKEEINSIIFI